MLDLLASAPSAAGLHVGAVPTPPSFYPITELFLVCELIQRVGEGRAAVCENIASVLSEPRGVADVHKRHKSWR